MKTRHLLAIASALTLGVLSFQAEAMPAFARSTHLACSSCHSAFPALNAFGRNFKTNGYRINPVSMGHLGSDFSKDVSKFPIAMAIVARPLVNNDPGGSADATTELRAIHEAEIFIGGVFYQKLSGFVEYEAEGEDGFGAVLGSTALNFDASDALHVQLAFAPTFFADPYDTLSDARKLSYEHFNITDDTFTDNADNGGKFRHLRQQISLFGRVADNKLFYNVGIGGLTEDNIASQSTATFARLAYDVSPSLMVGAFAMSGTCKTDMTPDFASCDVGSTVATKDRNFTRSGIDLQADIDKIRLTAAFMNVSDDVINSNASADNTDYYLQGVYFGDMDGKQMVPLLRYQSSENANGNDTTERLIAGLTYYPQDNLKATFELGKDTSVPSSNSKSTSTVIQLEAVF